MASIKAAWGIDIGQCAVKALRLQLAPDGTIDVTHFDLIEHPLILSQPDADAEQLIRNSLDKFLSRHEIGQATVVLAVPGQSSFARFIKLPPVEPRRIPEIVRFEAVQQIPFDIEEVEWDYQTFISPTSPDVEVGIFAMRKELVFRHLANLRPAGIEADLVQLAPLALYNMMVYDGQAAKQGATILIDIGAENTDLVISDGDRIWLRSIPLGGNNFTESLVKAFKLPFAKAESLKRTAATSKYARQIFVAMRPVFGDLVGEVQRSLGFYTSLHRDAHIVRVLCMGNAFRLPALQRYLEQNLQVEAVRPHAFNRLRPSPTVNAPAFAENLLSFGVAYGLALQGLGVSPIRSNLLPVAILKQRKWRAQRPWFAAAAAVMVLGVGLASWSAIRVNASVEDKLRTSKVQTDPVLAKHRDIQKQKQNLLNQGESELQEIASIKQIIGYRDMVLQVMYLIQESVPNDWRVQAEALVAEEKKKTGEPAGQISWPRDVLPMFRANPDLRERLDVYQIEQVQLEFFPHKPPPRKTAAPTGEPVGPLGPMGPAGPPAPPPMVAPAEPVEAVGTDRYFRVTVIGLTSVQGPRIASDISQKFLERILQLKKEDGQPGGRGLLRNIELDEREVRQSLEGYVNVVPPQNWPTAAGPAGPAGPMPAPADGQPRASVDPMGLENYKDWRFTVSFAIRIIPPAATAR